MGLFLSISELAERVSITPHTLRYYEKIGLVFDVAKDASGHRRYNDKDVAWVEFLVRLRSTGMSIQQMCLYAQWRREGNTRNSLSHRRLLLEQHAVHLQQEIERMQQHLHVIAEKISIYQEWEREATS